MACNKHIQRKRPNSCPDCAAELKKGIVVKEFQVPGRKKPLLVEQEEKVQTSREMLAELSSMEKEVDEMVIKPTRQKKDKAVNNNANSETKQPEIISVCIEKSREEYQAEIDEYFANKIKEFKSKLNHLADIQYEWFNLPLDKMSVKVMDKLYKDKWQLINFYTGLNAKASGFGGDVAVFNRIKGSGKLTVEETKRENK